jgi:hypothetical protein
VLASGAEFRDCVEVPDPSRSPRNYLPDSMTPGPWTLGRAHGLYKLRGGVCVVRQE